MTHFSVHVLCSVDGVLVLIEMSLILRLKQLNSVVWRGSDGTLRNMYLTTMYGRRHRDVERLFSDVSVGGEHPDSLL